MVSVLQRFRKEGLPLMYTQEQTVRKADSILSLKIEVLNCPTVTSLNYIQRACKFQPCLYLHSDCHFGVWLQPQFWSAPYLPRVGRGYLPARAQSSVPGRKLKMWDLETLPQHTQQQFTTEMWNCFNVEISCWPSTSIKPHSTKGSHNMNVSPQKPK